MLTLFSLEQISLAFLVKIPPLPRSPFLMSQPDVVSDASEPHRGLYLPYDIIFSRVLPSLWSWNAHSETMSLNYP